MSSTLFGQLQLAFAALGNAERAQGQAAYMRDQFSFIGMTAQQRRAAAAPIVKHPLDWDFVAQCWAAPQRDYQYAAADHLRRVKHFPADKLDELRTLIATKSWWDTVDSLAKVAGASLPQGTHTMKAWAQDSCLWVRRAAIICQLGRKGIDAADSVDTELLTHAIECNLGSTEFFINKAIGWALRDYYRHNPQWVLDFCDSHDLAPLSRREALKHHG